MPRWSMCVRGTAVGFLIMGCVAGALRLPRARGSAVPLGPSVRSKKGPGIANHPVGVVPSKNTRVPRDWPVDLDGSITCLTCHYGVPSPGPAADPLLRDQTSPPAGADRSDPSRPFCMRCHTDRDVNSAAAVHWMGVGAAHIRPEPDESARAHRGLDSASKRCMLCHDGVNAFETSNAGGAGHAFGTYGNDGGNHPVGVPYRGGRPRRNGTAYRHASLLPQVVRLPGGMVSCVSCHNLYAKDDHYLVMSNKGSALCLTCHDMR